MEGTRQLRLGAPPRPQAVSLDSFTDWHVLPCPLMFWSLPFRFSRAQGWGGSTLNAAWPHKKSWHQLPHFIGSGTCHLFPAELLTDQGLTTRKQERHLGRGLMWLLSLQPGLAFFPLNPFQALIRHGNTFSQLEILSPHTPVLLALSKQKMWFSWRTLFFGFKMLIVRKDSGGG